MCYSYRAGEAPIRSALQIFTVLLFLSSAVASMSVTAGTFVVIPVIGDQMMIFFAKTKITAGAAAERRIYPTNDPLFDNAAFAAAEDAIHKLQTDASVVMLRVNDHATYASIAGRPAAAGSIVDGLLSSLGPDVAKSPTTRVILIVPTTGQIKLPIQSSGGRTAGLPGVAGLGFYVDSISYYFTPDSSFMHSPGLVMSFASVGLISINPSTGSIEGGKSVLAVHPLAIADSDHKDDPWEALTVQQKTDALRQLLTDGIGRLVPALLAGSAAR